MKNYFLLFKNKTLGLTWQEKNELEKLRVEIKKYREFEQAHEKDQEKSFEESDEEDHVRNNHLILNLRKMIN